MLFSVFRFSCIHFMETVHKLKLLIELICNLMKNGLKFGSTIILNVVINQKKKQLWRTLRHIWLAFTFATFTIFLVINWHFFFFRAIIRHDSNLCKSAENEFSKLSYASFVLLYLSHSLKMIFFFHFRLRTRR